MHTVVNDIGGETGYHDRERKLMASEQGYYDRIVQNDQLSRMDDRHHCELCDLKDRDLKQLRAEQQMLSSEYRKANLGRFTAAGILRTMALEAWRTKNRTLLLSLATAFFAAKCGMNFEQAQSTAVEHICLADMHTSNSLFGKTNNLGDSWEDASATG